MSNNNPSINDFASASAYLAKGRDKTQRTLHGRSTTIRQLSDQTIAIRYHNTDIVTYCQNGDIVLNSGGYKTVTTKRKINEYALSGFTVFQAKSIWYVFSFGHDRQLFADGMILHSDGTMSGTLPASDTKRQSKLVRDINTYTKAFVESLLTKTFDTSGDCWACKGLFEDSSHLSEHMREKYYPASLILRAIAAFPVSNLVMAELHMLSQNKGLSHPSWADVVRRQLYGSLRRYMRRSFGLPSSM